MGMFDDVQCDAVRCPLCGTEMSWQSKDGPCTLDTLTVHELVDQSSPANFYSDCPGCRIWVEVTVRRQTDRTPAQQVRLDREKAIIADRKASRKPQAEEPAPVPDFTDIDPGIHRYVNGVGRVSVNDMLLLPAPLRADYWLRYRLHDLKASIAAEDAVGRKIGLYHAAKRMVAHLEDTQLEEEQAGKDDDAPDIDACGISNCRCGRK